MKDKQVDEIKHLVKVLEKELNKKFNKVILEVNLNTHKLEFRSKKLTIKNLEKLKKINPFESIDIKNWSEKAVKLIMKDKDRTLGFIKGEIYFDVTIKDIYFGQKRLGVFKQDDDSSLWDEKWKRYGFSHTPWLEIAIGQLGSALSHPICDNYSILPLVKIAYNKKMKKLKRPKNELV